MISYVFPGQGSQKKGMGSTIFDYFVILSKKDISNKNIIGSLFDYYKDLILIADDILGYSVKELCLKDSENKLDRTEYTQPALYVVNHLSYLKKFEETKRKPDYVAGHSSGEYNALCAAEVFDFAAGLTIIKKRGELMSKVEGSMAAIMGFNNETVLKIIQENNLYDIDIANYNTQMQTVISGPEEDVKKAGTVFEKSGVKLFFPLKAHNAFHSRRMKIVQEEFKKFLDNFEFSNPKIPVMANYTAKPFNGDNIKTNLVEQITNPVRWHEIILYLMSQDEMEFYEVGPGKVLSRIIKHIQNELKSSIGSKNVKYVTKKSTENTRRGSDPEYNGTALGNLEFKNTYNTRYAYAAGGMQGGISSSGLVVKMGLAGILSFLDSGGMKMEKIESGIRHIQQNLQNGEPYGINIPFNLHFPQRENDIIDSCMKFKIKNIEVSGYLYITEPLVKYRLQGLKRNIDGSVYVKNRILATVSRKEVAIKFLSPPPESIVQKLHAENRITEEEAKLSKEIPMADDLCIMAESAGHLNEKSIINLLPLFKKISNDMAVKFRFKNSVRIGTADVGNPDAAAVSFFLGADFVLTNYINQCSVEAGTSDSVKDILEQIDVHDIGIAPSGDLFEMGEKTQVVSKGIFFPFRANKLYDIFMHHGAFEEIDKETRDRIQKNYFFCDFDEAFQRSREYFSQEEFARAEKDPKHKMALAFRWYIESSFDAALKGDHERLMNYHVRCNHSLGVFNQWVQGTPLQSWKNRHVDDIAVRLMNETAVYLSKKIKEINMMHLYN